METISPSVIRVFSTTAGSWRYANVEILDDPSATSMALALRIAANTIEALSPRGYVWRGHLVEQTSNATTIKLAVFGTDQDVMEVIKELCQAVAKLLNSTGTP